VPLECAPAKSFRKGSAGDIHPFVFGPNAPQSAIKDHDNSLPVLEDPNLACCFETELRLEGETGDVSIGILRKRDIRPGLDLVK
jgi:hypothetical protein